MHSGVAGAGWRTCAGATNVKEHEELRTLASALSCADAGTLLRFADLLALHVRFEERELFEAAQSLMVAA